MLKVLLLLLLLPLLAYGGQPKPPQAISIGPITFPAGETIGQAFLPPTGNLGSFRIEIDCDPTVAIEVQTKIGTGDWGSGPGFSRPAAPCVDKVGKPVSKIIVSFQSSSAANEIIPVDSKTTIQPRVLLSKPFTTTLSMTFDMK